MPGDGPRHLHLRVRLAGMVDQELTTGSLAFYSGVYNRLYRFGYHRQKGYSHSRTIIARIADGRLPVRSVLDIGCSHGWAVAKLVEMGLRAVGVDVAEPAVGRGVKAGLDLHVASATALPFPARSFDLVMSTDCFEHLRPDDVDAAVEEAWRVSARYLAFKINPRPDEALHWKLLAGTRLHLTVRPVEFWIGKFQALGGTLTSHDVPAEEFVIEKPGVGITGAILDREGRDHPPAGQP